MKFVKQRKTIPIINMDKLISQSSVKQVKRKHGELLPDSIRCIICGPSNSGKTNLLLNLIFSPEGLHLKNIYIFSK